MNKIEIIQGRKGSGKSHKIYTKGILRAQKNKKSIIIVPEQYTLEAEQAVLNMTENSGIMDVMVMSITRFMNAIFDSVYRPSVNIIDEKGKTLVLKTLLKNNVDELEVFSNVINLKGFASSLSDLLGDLKKFDVSAQSLEDAISDVDEKRENKGKIKDVIRIMTIFQEYCKDNEIADNDDVMDILTQIIEDGSVEIIEFFEDCAIYFDSFDYLPPRNIRLICAMAKFAPEVAVTMTMDANDENASIFIAGKNSVESLTNYAMSKGFDVDYSNVYYSTEDKSPSIKHLEKYLYKYPSKIYDEECDLTITNALGINQEVEIVASSILHLIAQDKYTWRDISVLCSNLDQYSHIVSRVFKQYNIPYFLDERRSVSSHPFVVWLINALQCVQGFKRHNLLATIKSTYGRVNHEESELFEDYCISNSINGTMFLKKFRRNASKYPLDEINEIRDRAISGIIEFDKKDKKASEWAKTIFELIQKCEVQEIVAQEKQRLEDLGRLDESAQSAQTWNVVIETLEQLHSIVKDCVLSLDEVIELLEEAFLDAQIGILPTGINNVLIGDIGRSKSSSIQCLFIMGANDGLLPAPLPDGSIFSENELELLKEKNVVAGRDKEFRRGESAYSLYCALSAPRKELHISYDCNKDKRRAIIIDKLLAQFPHITVELGDVDPFSCPAAAFSLSANALGAIGDSRQISDGRWKSALSTLINDDRFASDIDKMYNFAAAKDIEHDIAHRRNGNLISSISQLEAYAKCPFAYMISYGLSPSDDPDAQIKHTSSGAFLHKLMEEFGIQMSEMPNSENLSDNEIDNIMRKKANELAKIFDEGAFHLNSRTKFLSEQLVDTARRGANVYVRGLKHSRFKPIGHEQEFRYNGEYSPICIDLDGNKKAYLTGKIDRVDEYNVDDISYLRAIDYKSGLKKINPAGILTGEDLQLFVYMDALMNKSKSQPAGVFYYPLRNDYTDNIQDAANSERLNGWFVDNSHVIGALDTSLQAGEKSKIVNMSLDKNGNPSKRNASIKEPKYMIASIKAAKESVKRLCNSIEKGQMQANPLMNGSISACGYCEYKAICRHGAQTNMKRQAPTSKEVDEYIESFMEVDE